MCIKKTPDNNKCFIGNESWICIELQFMLTTRIDFYLVIKECAWLVTAAAKQLELVVVHLWLISAAAGSTRVRVEKKATHIIGLVLSNCLIYYL